MDDILECPICLENLNIDLDYSKTICKHQFHTSCLLQNKNNKCPLCRTDLYIRRIDTHNEENTHNNVNNENRRGFSWSHWNEDHRNEVIRNSNERTNRNSDERAIIIERASRNERNFSGSRLLNSLGN